MMFIWLMVCIAGNVMQGQTDFVRTSLTSAISDTVLVIPVRSTSGYPDSGIIIIESEKIAYSSKTATSFTGSLVRPVARGAEGTEAASHTNGKQVTTVSGAMVNSSAAYNIAVMTDPAGALAFVTVPLAFFSLLGSFLFLPLQFLGTDLQILTYIWAVVGIGMLVAITMQLAGGRRV